ncbi:MAG: hypothetical protein LC768_03425, partial [Acidobacteria bacterium]|nr:hypothetical protein [Acidobacteriota bacterium]
LDGSRIAFTSNRDGNYEIYVMNLNGSNLARLTNNVAYDDKPSWGRYGPPRDKEQCKNDGWMHFDFPRTFKNQGDCIQFVNTGE